MRAREAIARVFDGLEGTLSIVEVVTRVRTLRGGDRWSDATLVTVLRALAPNLAVSRHYPTERRHGFLYGEGGGRFRLWNEATDGSLDVARASDAAKHSAKPGPRSVVGVIPDDLVRGLVDAIHADPFQPHYRRRPQGNPVVGWSARAVGYFWPHPLMDLRATEELMAPWFDEAGTLAIRLQIDGVWATEDRRRATVLAWQMLTWGGVTRQKVFGPEAVEQVFRRAHGLPGGEKAPMNSGWTKVAALATAYLEGEGDRAPHVIWDSRVSTSIVDRLEPVLEADGANPRVMLPGIGPVAGRGGTRPRPRRLAWSTGYGSWTAQEAGSAFVHRIRDVLNEGRYGAMPLGSGGEGRWTVRGVESVLFMDGY